MNARGLLLPFILSVGACAPTQVRSSLFNSTSNNGTVEMAWIERRVVRVTVTNNTTAEFCAYRDFQTNDGSQMVAAQFRQKDGKLSDNLNTGFLAPQDLTKVAVVSGQTFVFRHSFGYLAEEMAGGRGNPIVAIRISLFVVPCGSDLGTAPVRLVSPWIEVPPAP